MGRAQPFNPAVRPHFAGVSVEQVPLITLVENFFGFAFGFRIEFGGTHVCQAAAIAALQACTLIVLPLGILSSGDLVLFITNHDQPTLPTQLLYSTCLTPNPSHTWKYLMPVDGWNGWLQGQPAL